MVDALGRTIVSTRRTGTSASPLAYTSRMFYDIEGNLVSVIDPLGRVTLRQQYDFSGRRLRLESIDAGIRRAIGDAAGAELERTRQVIADDQLLSVFDDAAANNWEVPAWRADWEPPTGMTLEEHATDLLDPAEHETSQTYDALDRVKTLQHPEDVSGVRKLVRHTYNAAGALEQVELDGTTFVRHIAYNAKGQRLLIAYGKGVMTRYGYEPYTFRLARMRSERYTTPGSSPYSFEPSASSSPLQDLTYQYDLAGNPLRIEDRTPGCGVLNNPEAFYIADPSLATLVAAGDALVRRYEYDPLYQLIRASGGRECSSNASPRGWSDDARCGYGSGGHGTATQASAPSMTRVYEETFEYDPAGNLLYLKHRTGSTAWTRTMGMGGLTYEQWNDAWEAHLGSSYVWEEAPGNRATHVGEGSETTSQTHFYDANGNLLQEGVTRHFEWDQEDRLRVFGTQSAGAEPSVHVQYLYDAAGQRVKKLSRKQGGAPVEVTVYLNGNWEYHRKVQGGDVQENNTLHVMDDEARIALVRVGDAFSGDEAPAVQYHLGDHLGGSVVLVDDTGAWMNREEYTSFGETVFGSYARKRYRFTGHERDEESGLYYAGARYYAPWLGRWVGVEPELFGLSGDSAPVFRAHAYGGNCPTRYWDPNGRWLESAWDAASLVTGVVSFVDNVRQGNVGAAVVDGIGIVADGAALALPFVPGGAGTTIKAVRAADKVADTIKAGKARRDRERCGGGGEEGRAGCRVGADGEEGGEC